MTKWNDLLSIKKSLCEMKWFVDVFKWLDITFAKCLWKRIAKGFDKTSLSLLTDVFFLKNHILQDQTFRPIREEGWTICNEMTSCVLKIVKHNLFGQSVLFMHQTPVINKIKLRLPLCYIIFIT